VSINPPALKEGRATVSLPGTVRDVCVGGSGRYLVLHLANERKLAVFDANEARVVKYLPLADDRVLFAAGSDKLMVLLPDRNQVQRWSLSRLEREVTAPLAVAGQVHTAVMGAASEGPLVLGGPQLGEGGLPLCFLDVRTLKQARVDRREGGGQVGTHPQYPAQMRVSADGATIGMWTEGLSPSGLQAVVLTGSTVRSAYEHTSVGQIIPGPDGRTLFTENGLYTTELKPVHDVPGQGLRSPLPAVHGGYYLSVNRPDRADWEGKRTTVTVHLAGDARPLATLSDLEGLDVSRELGRSDTRLPLDKRLFLIPLAKLVVTIPAARDRLHLQRFDLDGALEKAGIDYLLVTSQPVTTAVRGTAYTYSLVVRSKKGGVKYKLDSGPAGMKVSPDGRLSWAVPAAGDDREADVLLTVSDASGRRPGPGRPRGRRVGRARGLPEGQPEDTAGRAGDGVAVPRRGREAAVPQQHRPAHLRTAERGADRGTLLKLRHFRFHVTGVQARRPDQVITPTPARAPASPLAPPRAGPPDAGRTRRPSSHSGCSSAPPAP
jgi:hypothetical protein